MHFAAIALVQAGSPEVVFGGHLPHVNALGDRVPGRPVRAVDEIRLHDATGILERGRYARGDGFLADVEMVVAAVAGIGQHLVGHCPFVPANAKHRPVHTDELIII